jgi:hypothetical protein
MPSGIVYRHLTGGFRKPSRASLSPRKPLLPTVAIIGTDHRRNGSVLVICSLTIGASCGLSAARRIIGWKLQDCKQRTIATSICYRPRQAAFLNFFRILIWQPSVDVRQQIRAPYIGNRLPNIIAEENGDQF